LSCVEDDTGGDDDDGDLRQHDDENTPVRRIIRAKGWPRLGDRGVAVYSRAAGAVARRGARARRGPGMTFFDEKKGENAT